MIAVEQDKLRCWVDNLLIITKEGIAPGILDFYKSSNSKINHLQAIKAALADYSQPYPEEAFANDKAVLEHIDLSGWLYLLCRSRMRNDKSGKEHVETLRNLRNKWAHQGEIICDEAQDAADASISLLEAVGTAQRAHEIREIKKEIILYNAHPSEDTELFQPIKEGGKYIIEVIDRNGKVAGCQVPILQPRILIGRGNSSDVQINTDRNVSRAHLLVSHRDENTITITDLRSANGTKIEDSPIKPNRAFPWLPGQRVVIGHTWLILRHGS